MAIYFDNRKIGTTYLGLKREKTYLYVPEQEPFAVYSADDKSLTFYFGYTPDEGDEYKGKTVTNLYTGFTDEAFSGSANVTWHNERTSVTTVSFDTSFAAVRPVSTAYWFYGFTNCTDINLKNLDASEATTMSRMFYNCSKLVSLDISSLDVSAATSLQYMFSGCSSLTELNVSEFDTGNVSDMRYMFSDDSDLVTIYSDDDMFVTTGITSSSNGNNMFSSCEKLVGGNGTVYDTDHITYTYAHVDVEDDPGYFTQAPKSAFAVYSEDDSSLVFYYSGNVPEVGEKYKGKTVTEVYTDFVDQKMADIGTPWFSNYGNITNVTFDKSFRACRPIYLRWWFESFINCESIDLTYLDTSNVIDMHGMFYDCSKLTSLNVSGFDTSNVTDMSYMFHGCGSFINLDVTNFNTSNVTDISGMFASCDALVSIDVSNFDTHNVTNMNSMFGYCDALVSIDVSNFDTHNVTNMNSMFSSCRSLTSLDLSNFDTSNVTTMGSMFTLDDKLVSLDISSFDTDNLTTTELMFYRCSNLKTIYSKDFITDAISDDYQMFTDCTSLVGGNGTTYDSSKVDASMAHVDVEGNPGYFTGKEAFAVYSSNDSSLTFYMDKEMPAEGSSYGGKTVTEVYTGFADVVYSSYSSVPWYSNHDSIRIISFDESFGSCRPISTAYWFYLMNNVDSVDWENLDTSSVTTMVFMFASFGGDAAKNLDLSSFDTSNVEYMGSMFNGSALGSLNTDGWDTSKVTSMNTMFYYCLALTELDVSNWDTSNVTDMDGMFQDCTNLQTIYSDDDVFITTGLGNLMPGSFMFYNCTNLVGGNGTTYSGSKDDASMAHVDVEDNPGYFTGKGAFAVYSADDSSLTFAYGGIPAEGSSYNNKTATNVYTGFDTVVYSSYDSVPWYSRRSSITSVVFDKSFTMVKPISMAYWFYNFTNCTNMNLTNLDTSEVTTMYDTFYYCSGLTSLNLSNFDTSAVTTMYEMFDNCSELTSLDVSGFDTSNVTTMYSMFYGCSSLTSLDVSNFDTSKVTSMSWIFRGCSGLTSLDVSNFDTSNVTTMDRMFYGCSSLTSLDVSNFDTSKVTSMSWIFRGCSSLTTLDVSGFDTSKVTDMTYMFFSCSNLTTIYSDDDMFVTTAVTSGRSMFEGCNKLVGGNGTAYDFDYVSYSRAHVDTASNPGYFTGNSAFAVYSDSDDSLTFYTGSAPAEGDTYNNKTVTNVYTGFDTTTYSSASSVPWYSHNSDIESVAFDESFNICRPIGTAYWFRGFENLASIDLTYLDTSEVTTMAYMFYDCTSLTKLDVSKFNTAKVTTMAYMFYDCSGVSEIDVSGFDTSNITNMARMFYYCSKVEKLDVSKFDTSEVTSMSNMFYHCESVAELDVGGWNTAKVTDMSYTFSHCLGITSFNITSWDTSSVTTMAHMFYQCSKLEELDVSAWNTAKTTNTNSMFYSCSNLATIYSDDSNFVVDQVTSGASMFSGCSKLVGGNGTKYSSSSASYTMAHVDTEDNPGYFTQTPD